MKYTLELEIDLQREMVAELIGDPEQMKHWQPDLLDLEPLSGQPGAEGSQNLLKYRMGKTVLEMTETIVENALPERLSATYQADKVWNRVENTFVELPSGRTRWIMVSEFKASGFMRFMVMLMPGMFKKQSLKYMNQFKAFAEGGS